MSTEPVACPQAEELRVHALGTDITLHAGSTYRIGRDPRSDIVIADPRVSWQHAIVSRQEGGWLLQDSGSTNGTYFNQQRVSQIAITRECAVRLGHPEDGPLLTCSVTADPEPEADTMVLAGPPTEVWELGRDAVATGALPPAASSPRPRSSLGRRPTAVLSLPMQQLLIGRAPGNDVVVSDLSVSRYHTELRRTSRGDFEIVDLDSYNGTFVNGQRVASAVVTEADLIGIGPATFRLVGDKLQEFIDTGDVRLTARDVTVTLPNGKVLLDNVSFPLGERCLLGVIGPSGAGKSTLIAALTGMLPADKGSVLYDGRDLYKHHPELRHRVGLVPQENILHTQLTARRALGYAAELRFPRDTSRSERERRIDEVLRELSLSTHAETRTSALSGGEQKRVNVALELLTKPSLLFLDEPTTGLDPGLDKSVMEMLAELAHDGRTVIVATHSVANLDLCDRILVIAPGGKMAYFGPPAEGLGWFGKRGWADVYQAFQAEPERDWAGEFRRSPCYARYVAAEMNVTTPVILAGGQPPATPVRRNNFGQVGTLCRRYLAVIASDRAFLAVLAATPLILGAVIRVIPAPQGLAGQHNDAASSLLLILTICACFAGAAGAVRELVKERAIYARERAAGLSVGAYLLSKIVILGLISALQAVVLVTVGIVGRPLPASGAFLRHLPLVELLLALGVLAIVSMTAGLLISSMADSSEKTIQVLIVVVIFQVVMTGGVFSLNGKPGLEQIAWASPSRWGFAAAAATSNLNQIEMPVVPAQVRAPGPARTPGQAASSGQVRSRGQGKPGSKGKRQGARSRARTHHRVRPSTHAQSTAHRPASAPPTASAKVGGGDLTARAGTDPLWNHTPRTWLRDMAAMVALGLLFALITWRRLTAMGPVKRR